MREHITIEIPTKFYGDILKNDNEKAYYLKIENNQVTEVLSCTELENITRKSSKSEPAVARSHSTFSFLFPLHAYMYKKNYSYTLTT